MTTKYLFFGDIHLNADETDPVMANRQHLEANLQKMDATTAQEHPDFVGCLGDFDSVENILYWQALSETLEAQGISTASVLGNHDLSAMYGLGVFSSLNWHNPGYHSRRLNDANPDSQKARTYLDSLPFQQELDIGNYRAIMIHGGLEGRLSQSAQDAFAHTQVPLTQALIDAWNHCSFRLRKYEDEHEKNFLAMQQAGYKVMIRAHGHHSQVAVYKGGTVTLSPLLEGVEVRLDDPDALYTITLGRLNSTPSSSPVHDTNGYTTIEMDGDVPVVKYHLLGNS